ncbi:MAG TPA: maleylpyruvate isomerase family mycothiol-dependent enzyme [Actinomycetota bacterium]|nr:maleylpyruvate isomerase family mycothiol-dependent enzyme [Actinomycetota bacterium]
MLPRQEALSGYAKQLEEFEALIRSLSDEQWRASTRCEGWKVSDVTAHVVGTLSEVVAGRAAGLGEAGAVDRVAAERKGMSQQELVDELRSSREQAQKATALLDDDAWAGPAPGDVAPTMGDGVCALWYDTYVHDEDIRAALGLEAKRGPGLRAAVEHLATVLQQDGWGPATIAVDGMEEFSVGGHSDRRITGDPLVFVLAATGRGDAAKLGLDETVNVYRRR